MDPGSEVMVTGSYVVRAVQTQVVKQGAVGTWEGDNYGWGSMFAGEGQLSHFRLAMDAEWRAAEEGGK